jgi:hypothetical protein
MGRPIGSLNKTKPFTDMLRIALLSDGGRRLRIIAERLAEAAERGDLYYRQFSRSATGWTASRRRQLNAAISRWRP